MEKDKKLVMSEVQIVRYRGAESCNSKDFTAREEPLEIKAGGKTLARLMRLPGDDVVLAAGFCLSEGLISNVDEVGFVPSTGIGEEATGETAGTLLKIDVIEVVSQPAIDADFKRDAKLIKTGSGGAELFWGVDLAGINVRSDAVFTPEIIAKAPGLLLDGQDVFNLTGATHAAAIFDTTGRLVTVKEDVGRHNAVDKALGHIFLTGENTDDKAMMLSGRLSFEMVLKVARAGLPLVCSISAPTSLGITVGEKTGVTLVGFLREGNFNVYSHSRRIGGV